VSWINAHLKKIPGEYVRQDKHQRDAHAQE
jgi:hypothetical protein